eukprot:5562825-Amphidinium_carterae.1
MHARLSQPKIGPLPAGLTGFGRPLLKGSNCASVEVHRCISALNVRFGWLEDSFAPTTVFFFWKK